MSPTPNFLDLSSRERQIMEIVFRLGQVTVAEIRAQLSDPPTPPAIRTMLARLEEKGCLKHRQKGAQNVYSALVPLSRARRTAVQRMMHTFFGGSPARTVAAILDDAAGELSDEDLRELARRVERARRSGR